MSTFEIVMGGAIVLLLGLGIFMLVVDPEDDPDDNTPHNG